MKIVIDIPESIYDAIMDDEMISREQLAVLEKHIYHGTPLPKGHGRLIDADAVDTRYSDPEVVETLDDAPTIIEADKAESEEGKTW